MIIYNVTVKIALPFAEEWKKWMLEKHIPDVMKTACFQKYNFCRILEDDNEGITYAIQYFAPSIHEFELYQRHYSAALQKDHTQNFDGKYVAFRTLLKLEESSEI